MSNIAEILDSYKPLVGLRANFVLRLTGEFSDSQGSSRGISSPEDRELLIHLRRLSDLVLVSAATASAEKLSSTKASTLGIVTGASAVQAIPALSKTSNAVVVFSPQNASNQVLFDQPTSTQLQMVQNSVKDRISPSELLLACETLGFTSPLSEFGPNWLRQLHAEQVIDELCLTITKSVNQKFALDTPAKALKTLLPNSALRLTASIELGENLFTRWQPSSPRRGNRLGDQ